MAILRVFDKEYDVPGDLLHAAGVSEHDISARSYTRNLGLLAGFLAEGDDIQKAVCRVAGECARIKIEQDASTSRQKILEIERDIAEAKRAAAEADLEATRIETTA